MENVEAILAQARDAMTVKRVFGDLIERDGVTVVPVAQVSGGGGGGGPARHGDGAEAGARGSGGGVGYGLSASPLGVYVIKDGDVSWQPAVNINRVIMGSQMVGALALVVIYLLLRARKR